MELPKLYTLDTFGLRSNTRELDTKYGEPRYAEINNEGSAKNGEMRLGESDCGEGPPDWPEKSPCRAPKGPCQPMGPPGYPAKERPEKKPFCVKCPPKKPCRTENCDPDKC
ncbi:hypothetical protein KPH14_004153 [Odynerus spinipes]|uniref:Uncharacterized protein n=1 Tax=Odynerus spinipes TaxID=1348599 RepID=A0AAD9VV26_9HYME|nr:hypothetical protein KPH14_004153 [Odynerus spinipes]